MNVSGTLYIGLRYLRRHGRKTGLLVGAITLALVLPLAILITVGEAEAHLRRRSESTPLLLGAAGSPLELAFAGLYFARPELTWITMGDLDGSVAERGARAIPLHVRHEARGFGLVGTTVDYLDLRGLELAAGTPFIRLGDCILGARVAAALDLAPGDSIVTSPTQVIDLAGSYPLKMRITGVLAPRGTADDRAILCDVKTAWVVDGLAHGHQGAAEAPEDTVDVRSADGDVVFNASIVEYAEVTPDNVNSFHFHGDTETFPITAAIVVPGDQRSERLLLGDFLEQRRSLQLVRPDAVMESLFATVFRIRDLVVASLAAVGVMALAIAGLVFVLSNRLRAGEFRSLAQLGADRGSVRGLVAFEAAFVAVASLALAGSILIALTAAVPRLIPGLVG